MKLITILFLCSRLLPSLTQESSQEIDCNDQDVFKAVDAALTKYNSENKSGNQFVLYRITEVARMDNPDTFYSLKYQIKEGDCPFQSNKTWQDCDYKDSAQAATGECTATVAKRGNMKFSVAIQTCLITPAEGPVVTAQYECLGCVHPISTKSPDLEPVLRYAIQYFNNNTSHSHLFDLKEVKRAQRQDTGECTDKAHVDVKLRISSFSQKCDLYPVKDFVQPPTRLCAGCPKPIPVDSPDLEEPLSHSIAKLNAEHDGAFYFKIDTVKKATVQVVAGLKYSIVFIARETTCSKGSNEELTKSCEINIHGQILHCDANVYVVPWEEKVYPTVNCQSLGQTSLMKRPPGFSPFRSVQVMKTEGSTTTHVKSCEYKGRPQEAGAEPATQGEVSLPAESPQLAR
uniref:Thiol proteinase inhibitor n=2 Tax=Bos TaxID=9903 RepID=A0AAA9TZR4_BOVIN